jgi:GAF domain-containing protein
MSRQQHPDNQVDVTALDAATAYAELARIAFSEHSLTETLQKVAGLARQALPDHPVVSVTLIDPERYRPRTVAFTGRLGVHLDERQYASGFGPCLDAAVSGDTIKLTMGGSDARYPDFQRVAQREGVTHSLSVGLSATTRIVGALNIYGLTERVLDPDAVRIALTFGGFAGIVLSNIRAYHDAVDLAAELQEAIRSRAVIDQAKGILMAQNHCSSEEAFQLLTRASQRSNVKLRIVAETLVERTARS